MWLSSTLYSSSTLLTSPFSTLLLTTLPPLDTHLLSTIVVAQLRRQGRNLIASHPPSPGTWFRAGSAVEGWLGVSLLASCIVEDASAVRMREKMIVCLQVTLRKIPCSRWSMVIFILRKVKQQQGLYLKVTCNSKSSSLHSNRIFRDLHTAIDLGKLGHVTSCYGTSTLSFHIPLTGSRLTAPSLIIPELTMFSTSVPLHTFSRPKFLLFGSHNLTYRLITGGCRSKQTVGHQSVQEQRLLQFDICRLGTRRLGISICYNRYSPSWNIHLLQIDTRRLGISICYSETIAVLEYPSATVRQSQSWNIHLLQLDNRSLGISICYIRQSQFWNIHLLQLDTRRLGISICYSETLADLEYPSATVRHSPTWNIHLLHPLFRRVSSLVRAQLVVPAANTISWQGLRASRDNISR
ncbi:hypothetical protein RRG08_022895 [Elysia crispata]|uniref:Uncharacterized protein n=1 Tax=Elysia crispata TaxID=231223 RepID=A0AAE0XN50_9GAST|nr:hypothetical protein RRG08_022895 [Elysia crispata]